MILYTRDILPVGLTESLRKLAAERYRKEEVPDRYTVTNKGEILRIEFKGGMLCQLLNRTGGVPIEGTIIIEEEPEKI